VSCGLDIVSSLIALIRLSGLQKLRFSVAPHFGGKGATGPRRGVARPGPTPSGFLAAFLNNFR
jgi:hypothetical protein